MLAVCCGMIRSGSTLQYNLVRNLVEATNSGKGMGFIVDPLLDHRLRGWSQDHGWHVVKMHGLAHWMLEEQARQSIRFFFSHRDLRDVAASAKRKFGWPSHEIWRNVDAAIDVQRCLQTIPEAQIHRYADLVADPAKPLAAIAESLGLTLSDAVKSNIVSACCLDTAQQVQEAIRHTMSAKGMSLSKADNAVIYDQTTLLHHNHISSSNGRDDSWQDDLTENDLQVINQRYGHWLQNEGYASR